MAFDLFRSLSLFRLTVAALLLSLAACSTTGSSFDSSALDLIRPGQTTLAQASALLKADPENVYHQGDGSVLARWAHKASFVPDAVYFNRELWLAFDRNGYFERVVKGVNVPQAGQADQTNRAVQVQRQHPVPVQTAPAYPYSSDTPVASPVRL